MTALRGYLVEIACVCGIAVLFVYAIALRSHVGLAAAHEPVFEGREMSNGIALIAEYEGLKKKAIEYRIELSIRYRDGHAYVEAKRSYDGELAVLLDTADMSELCTYLKGYMDGHDMGLREGKGE